tara:strand:- start:199 stop:3312 length:3114 start_codon:yes stop_codon:yes gene_type:complete
MANGGATGRGQAPNHMMARQAGNQMANPATPFSMTQNQQLTNGPQNQNNFVPQPNFNGQPPYSNLAQPNNNQMGQNANIRATEASLNPTGTYLRQGAYGQGNQSIQSETNTGNSNAQSSNLGFSGNFGNGMFSLPSNMSAVFNSPGYQALTQEYTTIMRQNPNDPRLKTLQSQMAGMFDSGSAVGAQANDTAVDTDTGIVAEQTGQTTDEVVSENTQPAPVYATIGPGTAQFAPKTKIESYQNELLKGMNLNEQDQLKLMQYIENGANNGFNANNPFPNLSEGSEGSRIMSRLAEVGQYDQFMFRAPPRNINTEAAEGMFDSMDGARNEMNYEPSTITGPGYTANSTTGTGYTANTAGSQGYNANTAGSQGYNANTAASRGYDANTAASQGYNSQGYQGEGYNAARSNGVGYDAERLGRAEGFAGAQVDSRGYNSVDTGSQGYGATNSGSQGYQASQVGNSPTVGADLVRGGLLSELDLNQYINPYENQVVQNTISDLDRSRQMQQAQSGAQASAAGAFGGSRQALLEAENNRNYFDQVGKTTSGLRQQGFENAQQLARSDIQTMLQADLANQGAQLQGDSLSANLEQQRMLANQNSVNNSGQFGAAASNAASLQNANSANQANQFSASAANTAALANQAARNNSNQFGAQAFNTAEAQRSSQDQAARMFGAQSNNQFSLANQAAGNNAAQFGAQATNTSNLANQAADNAAMQFTAQANNTANQFGANAANQANQFGATAANAAQLANANARNNAAQFGSQAFNSAALANANSLNNAGQFGSQAANTAALANANALNNAGQFGSQASNNAALANVNSLNNAGQFGAQATNNANNLNAAALNNAAQFGAGQDFSAQLANQQAGLAGSQQRLSAGNQLGNLSNLGFGMGQTLSGNLAQDGAMKQGLQQLLIDAIKNQYAGYTGAPGQTIGLLSQALGASPVPTSETTSKTPGLFDYLTLGASVMSDMRLKTNIEQVGNLPSGLGIYTWDWTDDAINDGLAGDMTIGVLAQEAQVLAPDAVVTTPSGYFAVNYAKLLKGL